MYGPFITFEIKFNPIPHEGIGRVNPISYGASVWNGPPYQENCLFLFFPPSPPPSQVLVSFALTTSFKTSLLSLLYFSVFFLDLN